VVAQFTASDKRTLIGLFAVLTIVQIIDIGQDYTNHVDSDQDRNQIQALVERNNNLSDKVVEKLNLSGNNSQEFRQMLIDVLAEHINSTMENNQYLKYFNETNYK